ncbi:MAG: gamma carbonic anhydrase family protein, partial [Duodenibacillus sp.]
MAIFALADTVPSIADSAWVAESAQVIGRVELGADASIWPGAVLRGDIEAIRVGRGSNVQDNAVLHTDSAHPCVIEEDVTVGHGAILHGCQVGAGALIGMGATVLNGAVVGRDAVVGAGALVAEGKTVEAGTLVVGCPARYVRHLTPEEIARNRANTAHYVDLKDTYRT